MKTETPEIVILSEVSDPLLPSRRVKRGFFAAFRMTDKIVRGLVRLPTVPLLGLIWFYQRGLAPVLPAFFGPGCGCRFHPTCSHYAADALRTHGLVLGGFLAARRLLRCTPFHPGGIDPVPPSGALRRVCRREPSSRVTV